MLDQFVEHCNEFHLLPDFQSAYRKGYSCETALVNMCNGILWSMEKCEITAVAVMDLSAAFDTVDHDILLKTRESQFGIHGNALQWFDSYLRPQNFKVCVNDSFSNIKELLYSVPQGSSSGAFLYICYASSISEVVPSEFNINGFADDHSIRKSFKAGNIQDELRTVNQIKSSMKTIKNWMTGMRLKMNDEKSEFIMFGNQRQLDKATTQSIGVNGTTINNSNCIKYLGAYLDSNLTLKEHIKRKCKSALFNYFRLKSIRRFLTLDSCTELVISLVISHLDYANGILIGIPKVDLNKLQRVQNMSAKLILGKSKYDSVTECLRTLHWLPIHRRIEFKVLTLVHNCIYGDAPSYLKNLIVTKTASNYNLRSESDSNLSLRIPYCSKKTFAERSFSVAGPRMWNNLPVKLRQIESHQTFRKQLKTELFKREFY